MKKTFLPMAAIALMMASASSCAKCVVCKDKHGDQFEKFEFCDKDASKGDIDDAIEYYEDNGYKCHAKSRIL